jgi:nitroreductase
MDLPLSPWEVLTTTRTVRKRLDLERPVERDTIQQCLRAAFQAPNGSNRQLWNWVVVDDAETRSAMAGIYRRSLLDYVELMSQARARRAAPVLEQTAQRQRMSDSVLYLNEHLHQVPVLVVPTVAGKFDGTSVFDQASRWGSVLPGVWSFMLALRTKGMGSAWTTLHLLREQEMAELLGIPFAGVTQAGLFPVAYTLGTDFHRADRAHSEGRIGWNRWPS